MMGMLRIGKIQRMRGILRMGRILRGDTEDG